MRYGRIIFFWSTSGGCRKRGGNRERNWKMRYGRVIFF
jgi:hypothetical protein